MSERILFNVFLWRYHDTMINDEKPQDDYSRTEITQVVHKIIKFIAFHCNFLAFNFILCSSWQRSRWHTCILVLKKSISKLKCIRAHCRGLPRKIQKSASAARRDAACNAWRNVVVVARYIITSGSNACRIDDYKSGEIKGLACSASWEHRIPSPWQFVLLA